MTADQSAPMEDSHSERRGATTAAPGRSPVSRATLIALGLAVTVLVLVLVSTQEARVPLLLQVAGTHATLTIEGRSLQGTWPRGITGVVPLPHPANARLFQVDGTDLSGTQTFDPATFAATAATPYYRFLCWMRDCNSYSRWRDFSVRDDRTGRMLLTGGDALALGRLALPPAFTLRGVLERPDLSGDLQFTGAASERVGVSPDGRQMYLGDTSQYYPYDPVPYLAEVGWTLSRAYLWSVALLLAIGLGGLLLARLPPIPARLRSPGWWPPRRLPDRGVPYVAVGLILLLLLGISNFTYQRLPRVFDATAYYFQAKIIASGHFWVPPPPSSLYPFFDGAFMVNMPNGHWFAQYAPGTSLAIALGLVLRLSWAVEPILGAACVLLMAGQARRWYGRATALLTLLLAGTSPFFLFLASSYLSHTIGLFALLLCLEGIDRLSDSGDWRWAALAGLGGGYALLTRELDTALFLGPVVIFYAWRDGRALVERPIGRAQLHAAVALCAPALLCLGFYLLYNAQTTGHVLQTPRAAFDYRDTWGFGPGHGWNNLHTVAAGLFVVENQLTALLIHLFGWPYYLTLGFFFIPLVTLRARRHDLLLYALAATFLLGYGGYFYHGIAFGPRYIFASLPAYVLLTARGIAVAAEIAAGWLRRLATPERVRVSSLIATALALAALLACNLTWYLPRQFSLYYDYLEQRADGGLGYERLHPAWMHDAVVLAQDSGFYRDVLFPLNDPALRGDIIYALVPGSQNIKPLMDTYPRRARYMLTIYKRQLALLPMRTLAGTARTVDLQGKQGGAGLSELALDPTGALYAADRADATIERFSAAGAPLGSIATGGANWDYLPIGIHGDALYWYVPHTSTFWRADLRGGNRRKTILQPPCGACHDFAFAPDGDIVFAATADSVLYRYSPQGKLLATSPRQGVMKQPATVAATANGHIFTYDLELKRTFVFDGSLRPQRTLPFGSESEGGLVITQLVAAGDWLLGTDPGYQRLVAYNARSGVLRDAMVEANGDLLPPDPFGLAWDGRRLAIAAGSPTQVRIISTAASPF